MTKYEYNGKPLLDFAESAKSMYESANAIREALSLIVCLPDDIAKPINDAIDKMRVSHLMLNDSAVLVVSEMQKHTNFVCEILKESEDYRHGADEILEKAQKLVDTYRQDR